MCEEHKYGGLFEDPERLKKYQKLFISRINNDLFVGYISPFVTGEMINSV